MNNLSPGSLGLGPEGGGVGQQQGRGSPSRRASAESSRRASAESHTSHLSSLGLDGGRSSAQQQQQQSNPSSLFSDLSLGGRQSSFGTQTSNLSDPQQQQAAASPQLVYQSETTAVYRLGDTGFKVALAASPGEEQVLKLMHEQNISNFLPWNCRKRKVTDVTSFNRRPALSFKWANGITLSEWMAQVGGSSGGSDDGFNVKLRAAMAISKTLSDFHDGGVVYNSLSPENVVLAPVEGEYAATLIDLSKAVIYKSNDGNAGGVDPGFERQMKEGDLTSLGLVLNQLFREDGSAGAKSGPDNAGGDLDSINRSKRRMHGSSGEGLPLYLSSLISALLDTTSPFSTGTLRYESARDVYLDLRTVAEDASGKMLARTVEDEGALARGKLNLRGDMFYGRQVQMSMLLHLFQSSVALGSQPLMATVSGYPGTGKSTLVNQMKQPLFKLNGVFIEGKFDKAARPDTILASALDSFFGSLVESERRDMGAKSRLMSMKWRIRDALGSQHENVMLEILPNLKKWMAEDVKEEDQSSGIKGIGSCHRLKFMFCKLIGAIACRANPLVLFLDDLQWADEMSLDIIRMIMTDPDIRHFLFLGCYRENEVSISHPLTAKLNAIQQQGVSVVNIKIGPIEKECVNTLLSEVLCLPPSLCRPLSTVVHSKTGGIILFILRLLASLADERDLWFSLSSRRWMFNIEEIRLKEIHGDVVSHMTEHMKSLPKKMRAGLKVCACLGPNFDAQVLEKAMKDDELEDSFLESCVDFGFLQNFGDSGSEQSDQYVWAHDQIQQAAYDIIPLSKRESVHLLLGSRLLLSTSPNEMNHMIFFIVDNMNRGSRLIDNRDQRYEVSQLNLEAGEKALTSSGFQSAAKYLMKGLSLLSPDCWDVKYNLTMRLYDAASEALFVTGDFDGLSQLIEKPLLHARSFEDKLNINNNLVRALAASSKFSEGIEKCMDILAQLGEVIPSEITADVYCAEVAQVQQLVNGKSREELLSLPVTTETKYLAAMQFMNHALTMTFAVKPILNPILVFRMVRMSINHGICNISAFAFGCYGAWLVSEPTCDVEGGYNIGRVALEMMKRLDATEMTPRLYATVIGLINIWKEPWQATLDKHLEAYEIGANTGDMEFAATNLYQYSSTAIYSGENLGSLSQSLQSHAKRAFQCNQIQCWKSILIVHQLALDLMNIDQNAFLPYSNGMTEDTCFAACQSNNEISVCRLITNKKKYAAFFTGDLETAARMYDVVQNYPTGSTGRLVNLLVNKFIDGMIGFFFARKYRENDAKWTNVGLDAIQSLRKWVASSDWNFSNKLYLLKAEYYFLREEREQAVSCYSASIKAAREHRFVHEEGLAEEKFATYLLHISNHDEAMVHFMNSKKCYEAWGAHALVQRVDKAIAILLPLSNAQTLRQSPWAGAPIHGSSQDVALEEHTSHDYPHGTQDPQASAAAAANIAQADPHGSVAASSSHAYAWPSPTTGNAIHRGSTQAFDAGAGTSPHQQVQHHYRGSATASSAGQAFRQGGDHHTTGEAETGEDDPVFVNDMMNLFDEWGKDL